MPVSFRLALAHMWYWHIYLITIEERVKHLHPIDSNAVNHITVTLDPGEGFGLVRSAPLRNVLQAQLAPARSLKGKQHSTIAAE